MSTQKAHAKTTHATVVPFPPRPKPRAKPRRIRIRGENEGCYLVPRSGVYHLRWPDPVSGQVRSESTGTRDRAAAVKRLVIKARWLRGERERAYDRRAEGAVDAAPRRIDRAARDYWDALAAAPLRSASTLYSCEVSLRMFSDFCASRGAVYLQEITSDLLADYYQHLMAQPGRRGTRVAISTVNQRCKPLRAVLRQAHADGDAPSLNDNLLKRRLPLVPVRGESQRTKYQLEHARAMERPALKACMRTLLDSPRYRGAAIDVALILLYGVRRAELTKARVMHVTRDGLRLPAEICKGYRSRHVPSDGFTALGQALLDILAHEHEPNEWLSEGAYSSLGTVFAAIGVRGHDLRASCETYQLSLSVSIKHATARMGHTLAIADESYLALLETQPKSAPTIEAAMGIEAELHEVLALATSRAVLPRSRKRAEYRCSVRRPNVKGQ